MRGTGSRKERGVSMDPLTRPEKPETAASEPSQG